MKRGLLLLLTAVFGLGVLAGCGSEGKTEDSVSVAPPEIVGSVPQLRFLLPQEADKNIVDAHQAGFAAALQEALRQQGWTVDEIGLRVAETENAAGKALDDKSAEVAILPASQYFSYGDAAALLMTATKPGVSVDTTEPAPWNGSVDAPSYTDREVPYSRTLICTTVSPLGQEIAQQAKNGTLTWETMAEAEWLMPKTLLSSDFLYPQLYLKNTFGKQLEELPSMQTIDGYGALFHDAAVGAADVIVIAADKRIDYAEAWRLAEDQMDHTGKLGLGRKDSIFNEVQVIGVTDPIFGDVMALRTEEEPYQSEGFREALKAALGTMKNDPDARAIWESCGYTGFVALEDSAYDNIREETIYGAGD